MRLIRLVTIGLMLLALLQAYAAYELLGWGIPLFGDPPMLGNGAISAVRELKKAAQQDPEGFKYITNIDQTFLWFFNRHQEGVLLSLIAGVAFALSAVVSLLFAALLIRRAAQGSGGFGT